MNTERQLKQWLSLNQQVTNIRQHSKPVDKRSYARRKHVINCAIHQEKRLWRNLRAVYSVAELDALYTAATGRKVMR